MKEIRIWEVEGQRLEDLKVQPIENVDQTETEQLLEEILTKKPELLLPDLRLVGRQTDTPGGPLDLLGVDGDGRLVIFELKKGTLTRDAVAQILDYASYLDELAPEELSLHISDRSGKGGVNKIENFLAWYQEQFAKSFNGNQKPRMILVGLGADERTRRMVSFMAKSDLEVSLITFYGFKKEGRIFLARQIEVESKPQASSGGQKAKNLEKLQERVSKLAVGHYYFEMEKSFKDRLAAYEWPNPGGFTYYLPELTESGNESNRAYVSLYLYDTKPGMVQLFLHARAVEVTLASCGDSKNELSEIMNIQPNGNAEVWIKSKAHWEELTAFCTNLCTLIVSGWKQKREVGEKDVSEEDTSTNAAAVEQQATD